MIAALLLRFGIPRWVADTAAIVLLAAGLWAGFSWHDHTVFDRGVAQERTRRDAIDARASAAAQAEKSRLDQQLAQTQAQLDAAIAAVAHLQSELDHEQAVSVDRQQRLLAGTERERVLIRAIAAPGAAGAAGPAAAAGPAGLDPGGAIAADLDGRAASDLEWVRQTRNDALKGLRACIASYDAVKAAADRP